MSTTIIIALLNAALTEAEKLLAAHGDTVAAEVVTGVKSLVATLEQYNGGNVSASDALARAQAVTAALADDLAAAKAAEDAKFGK